MIESESKSTAPIEAEARGGERARPRWGRRLAAAVVLAAAAVGLAWLIRNGIRARTEAGAELRTATMEAAEPFVNVVHPKLTPPAQEVVLPGNTQAFIDSPIYARTNGYLVRWYYDIGASVKKGALLADIETPEVDKQLEQARAQLESARADLSLARITADRWQFLLKSDSVSKQETDQAVSNLGAKKAAVDSALANVRRLEELQSFEKVYAPFDGIVTARNTDIGYLINAGASGQGQQLFHMAAIGTLRVYVEVPENYSRAAVTGAEAYLTLDEFPNQKFHGTLVRTSKSISATSRTLLTEVDVDNPTGQLLPGAYVSVHLKMPKAEQSVTVPANTLLFRSEGLRVGRVRDGKVELAAVTIGRDYGSFVEVVSGLGPEDEVILDPADSLAEGAAVRVNRGGGGGAGR